MAFKHLKNTDFGTWGLAASGMSVSPGRLIIPLLGTAVVLVSENWGVRTNDLERQSRSHVEIFDPNVDQATHPQLCEVRGLDLPRKPGLGPLCCCPGSCLALSRVRQPFGSLDLAWLLFVLLSGGAALQKRDFLPGTSCKGKFSLFCSNTT